MVHPRYCIRQDPTLPRVRGRQHYRKLQGTPGDPSVFRWEGQHQPNLLPGCGRRPGLFQLVCIELALQRDWRLRHQAFQGNHRHGKRHSPRLPPRCPDQLVTLFFLRVPSASHPKTSIPNVQESRQFRVVRVQLRTSLRCRMTNPLGDEKTQGGKLPPWVHTGKYRRKFITF
jgi:hypothetical protein